MFAIIIEIILLILFFSTKSFAEKLIPSETTRVKSSEIKSSIKTTSDYDLSYFLETLNEKKVSLVMTSEYYNAPASALGHTLLVFHNGEINDHSQVIHFSAIPNPSDSFLDYLVKGVSGGYKSYYFREYFYKKRFEYSLKEERDLYIYDLNLSQNEILNLKKILFEMQFQEYDYFFFQKNCSYRLFEIISHARGIQPTYHTIYAPYDIVADLDEIIIEEKVIFSETKNFINSYNRLLLDDSEKKSKQDFRKRLTDNRNTNLNATVFHYNISRFRAGKTKEFTNNFYNSSPAVSSYPSKTNKSHVFKRVSTLGISTNDRGVKEIKFRPLYKDSRDFQEKSRDITMNLLEFSIKEQVSIVSLHEFTLFEMGINSPYNRYLNNYSWNMFLGRKKIHSYDKNQFASAASSLGISEGQNYLVGGHLNIIYSERVVISPEIRLMKYIANNYKLNFRALYHVGYKKKFITSHLNNIIKISKDLDLIISHQSLPANDYSIELRLHF